MSELKKEYLVKIRVSYDIPLWIKADSPESAINRAVTDEDDKELVRRAKVEIIDNCIKKCRIMIEAERERLDTLEKRINKELEDCANE